MAAEPIKGSITPESLVTEESVKKVLREDKGKEAYLISWKVVDFTKRGDNYACVVTSVHVKYSLDGKQQENIYIVKLNPCRGNDTIKEMTNVIFTKESKFYLELLPELNSILDSIGEPPLNFPRCFYACLDMEREYIYFEDLRQKGFKMYDKKKGMDVAHASLVLKELARLHSASMLLQNKIYPQVLEVKHDYLLADMFTFSETSKNVMLPMLESNLVHAVKMLEKIGGYEKAISWVKSLKPEIVEIFTTGLRNNKYDLVCHGDCWNNNILFRYNSEGKPVEVMLLDLQICRIASPATDLNYFMYTSMTGEVRKPGLNSFLNLYYSSFKRIMDAGGASTPFTEEELLKEFRARNKLGAIFGMSVVPLLLVEPEEAPDLSQSDNFLEDMMTQMREKAIDMLDSNPMTKPRFLATFDEMTENGLIS